MFRSLVGKVVYQFMWEDVDTGWGTNIIKPPNYMGGMQRWRGQLTETRDTVTFADEDKSIIGSLNAVGSVVDSKFWLYGQLDGEGGYGSLFAGLAKNFSWRDGITTLELGNPFEKIRSGRFISNYLTAMNFEGDAYRIAAIAGTDVILNNPLTLDRGNAVVYLYEDGAGLYPFWLGTNAIVAFDQTASGPSVEDGWEFAIAGFGPETDDGVTDRFQLSIELNRGVAAEGNYLFAVKPKTFVGSPMTLIREFLSGTSTDIGWEEDADFVVNDSDIFNQAEYSLTINYRANQEVSVLSYIDDICENALISMWVDRAGIAHVYAFRNIDLGSPPTGTISKDRDFTAGFQWSYNSDDIVTVIDMWYGNNPEAGSPLGEWTAHKKFTVPDFWPGILPDVVRTRTLQTKLIEDPDIARNTALRILGRHFKGVPEIEVNGLLTLATVNIADIELMDFPLLDVAGAYYEVADIRDDLEGCRINVRLQSGTALYQWLGLGAWEDSPWSSTSDHAVSGTSTFGWCDGTHGVSVGTCEGIDAMKYGSTYRWA